jgi:polysaccharide biosynthesis protein PslG
LTLKKWRGALSRRFRGLRREHLLGCLLLSWLALVVIGCRSQPTPTPLVTDSAYTQYLPLVRDADTATPTPARRVTALPATTKNPTPVSPLSALPSPTPWPPPVFKPDWGIQLHLFGVDIDQVLGWAQGMGVGWIKQQVEWTNIEHAPGQYDWRELDVIVDKAGSYDLQLMLSVNHAPGWTRSDTTEYGPPHDPAEFARFMGVLAARYQGRVAAYELWNEPNLRREWHGEPLDPALFVTLIRAGAQAIRAADPAAQIISGGPAVTGINDGETAVDDRVYLRGMIEAGVGEWVDGIGVHPYGFANPPQERAADAAHHAPSHNNHPSFFFRDTLEDYRALLVEGGLETTPLWVTEFGWPSVDRLGAVDTSGWEYARHVDEAQQAEYVVQAFQMGQALDWVGPMILWNLNVATIWGGERPESAYSVLRPDASYRPVYLSVRLAQPQGD